ncbi:response regulator [Blautia marasmi]|uniref:response regulator n=1 Tax=Blautia marasmi TaxID=1917868 RepID=UPI003AB9395A
MNHVLIIDNDLLTCKEIKYSLQDDITDVYYTQSVEEAIHMLQKESYSLVIMDACLSQYGGTALIQQIRQMNPLPILALYRYISCLNP